MWVTVRRKSKLNLHCSHSVVSVNRELSATGKGFNAWLTRTTEKERCIFSLDFPQTVHSLEMYVLRYGALTKPSAHRVSQSNNYVDWEKLAKQCIYRLKKSQIKLSGYCRSAANNSESCSAAALKNLWSPNEGTVFLFQTKPRVVHQLQYSAQSSGCSS